MSRSLAAVAIALALAAPSRAAVDLEARRLSFDRADGVYLPTDKVTLTLAYEADGTASTLTEVFLRIEFSTDPPTRITYIMNEVRVPSGPREFVMKADLADRKITEGRYDVRATIDSKNLVAEMDEGNNTARTTIEVRRAGSTSTASTPTGTSGSTSTTGTSPGGSTSTRPPGSATTTTTTGSGNARRLAARDARTVSQTSCSEFERAWASPMEAGWHPGFGSAVASLQFDHPLAVPRSGERIRRSRLVIAGSLQGRPLATLGALQVGLRSVGSRDARCPAPRDLRSTHEAFDDTIQIDLATLIRDAEALPWECAERLQVTLSFPEARTEPTDAALLVLDAERTGIDVEVEAAR